jgi:c-di-GMP-binding flagellar brake protein YcgR
LIQAEIEERKSDGKIGYQRRSEKTDYNFSLINKFSLFLKKNILKIMNPLHVTSKNTVTIVCSDCNRARAVDVSKYIQTDKKVTVKIKCPCGNKFISYLNKRRQYRKTTNVKGTYSINSNGKGKNVKKAKICDLSASGMKLKIKPDEYLSVGDNIIVEFYLDDIHTSFIRKKAMVRSIRSEYIGVEFNRTEEVGKALGFYLYFNKD